MTDIDDIRGRMHALTEQARRALRLPRYRRGRGRRVPGAGPGDAGVPDLGDHGAT